MDFAAFSIWKPAYASEKLRFEWQDDPRGIGWIDCPVLETEPIHVADTRTSNGSIGPSQSNAAK
jgi:hypothetical protein